jgi:DNA-directed RNA polymerase subunit K
MSEADEYEFPLEFPEDENLEPDDDDAIDSENQTLDDRTPIVCRGTDRTSLNLMTRFEKARLIAARAEQIQNGSPVLVETSNSDSIVIAEEELRTGKIPISIRRNMPDGRIEVWKVSELRPVRD